ncbi:MAG: Gfo/Idh/MocA family oxidoreductase [Pirellulales bacterium]
MSRLRRGLSRRHFTNSLAAIAAGVPAWVAGRGSAAAPPRRSPLSRLRIAAIGVGNRGETNLLSVAQEEVVAMCDVDRRYLEERAERFPNARRYSDYRDMLAREQDLDAVVISSPDHTHAHAARLAMRRGLHVYCEKPLVHRFDELAPLLNAARQAGVVTRAGNQHHASDGYRAAIAWLDSGRLGDISAAHAWTDRPFWPQGELPDKAMPLDAQPPAHLAWDLWLGPAPPRPYRDGYHPMNWRGYWDFGSGALGDRGPHLLDPLFTGLKLGDVVEIRPTSSPSAKEMAPAWSVIDFLVARPNPAPPLAVTWYDGGKQPPREVTGIQRLPPNGCLVIGSEAKLFIPELGGTPRVLPNPGRSAPSPPRLDEAPALPHIEQWVVDCKNGGSTDRSFADAAALTKLALLGNAALRTGHTLRWDAKAQRVLGDSAIQPYFTSRYRDGWTLPAE